jgi:hypothetical protein
MVSTDESYEHLLEKYQTLQNKFNRLKEESNISLLQSIVNKQNDIISKQNMDIKYYQLEIKNREEFYNKPFQPIPIYNPLTKQCQIHPHYTISKYKAFTF